jgi:hypothetical protein
MSPPLPEDTTTINVPELQRSSPIEELDEIEIHDQPHDPLPP